MIKSILDYRCYLEQDRQSTGIPQMNSLKSKLIQLFFPSYEWQFIKSLRWLEYCENVKKKRLGGQYFGLQPNTDSEGFL